MYACYWSVVEELLLPVCFKKMLLYFSVLDDECVKLYEDTVLYLAWDPINIHKSHVFTVECLVQLIIYVCVCEAECQKHIVCKN